MGDRVSELQARLDASQAELSKLFDGMASLVQHSLQVRVWRGVEDRSCEQTAAAKRGAKWRTQARACAASTRNHRPP